MGGSTFTDLSSGVGENQRKIIPDGNPKKKTCRIVANHHSEKSDKLKSIKSELDLIKREEYKLKEYEKFIPPPCFVPKLDIEPNTLVNYQDIFSNIFKLLRNTKKISGKEECNRRTGESATLTQYCDLSTFAKGVD